MDGERHLPSAKKLRDIYLAEVRSLEIDYRARERFGLKNAELWAEALNTARKAAIPDRYEPGIIPNDEEVMEIYEVDSTCVRDLIYDEVEQAPESNRMAFAKVATATTLPLSIAVEQYLQARAPDNPYGNKPLSASSGEETHTAVNYLCAFFDRKPEALFLDEVTPELASEFRYEFLPKQTSKRSGKGLTAGTADKLVTLLRGLWRWAIARRKVQLVANPFKPPEDDVPRETKSTQPKRDQFKPEETQKILEAAPQGERMGDLFRVGLVTGARVSEIAKVTVEDTKEDGSVFLIAGGKTENAKRVVPVPEVAQPIIQRLRKNAVVGRRDRLFHEFPLSPSKGNASSASKAFTYLRRKVLKRESDERLAFHSLRHTWMTASHRAGVSIDDAHNLGGWAGVKRSSTPYNHGLNDAELAEAQEKVAGHLSSEGYLDGF